VKMDPVDTFHLPDGSRFAVPADFAAYLAKLHADFPHERAALDTFFAEVREAYLLGLLEHFRGRETERLAPYRDLTVRQALDRRFADRKLKLLLTADCPHWGSPPGRTSFVFDSMLRLSYFLGNYYPKGGSQAFADELARCFEERGGHILMSTAARRIVVEGGLVSGVARGVVLETLRGPVRFQGTVECGAVVSNADLLGTLEHLVGAEHLPPGTLPRLRGLRPTFPCWLTHIGLAGVPAEALEQAQGYYWDSWDMDRVGRDALRFKLFVPTLYEPAMAPPGGQVLIVQKVQELDYGAVTDWPDHKRQVERFIVEHLSRMIPGIEDKIVVRTSASAETSWRFTLNHQGAMLGWEMSPDQLGAGRPDLASPVRNLFFAGHWVRPGGGITPVIVSAQHAAQAVTGAMSRREWPPRPLPASLARPPSPPLQSRESLPAAPPPAAPDLGWANEEGLEGLEGLNLERRERAEA
jgi:all-trans-retinol 13,14-reductase